MPEVEVLVRHLAPLVSGRRISSVQVRRERVLRPTRRSELQRVLCGSRFGGVRRRGKYLVFKLRTPRRRQSFEVLGHLGMTGRMYLLPVNQPLPKHAAVVLGLGREHLVFEDTRYFGRFSLDTSPLAELGPEPLESHFTLDYLRAALGRSMRPIKVKLLDQTLVAGLGNIYASEALHVARISPRRLARTLKYEELARLRRAIRQVLKEAVLRGSTVPLRVDSGGSDALFHYRNSVDAPGFYEEGLRVYDRAGRSCRRCGGVIRRSVLAGRSTYFCARCQR